MVRIVITALFSLLLVGMQREMLVHEVDHLRAKVAVGHDKVLQKTAGDECLECALLASGTSGAPSPSSTSAADAQPDARVAVAVALAPAVTRPSPYQSRAPPIFL